jgi:predicted Zn-dependent protease
MMKKTVALTALCLAVSMPSPMSQAASAELPDIGTAAAGTLTIAQEKNYGDAYMRMIRAGQPVINDPVLNTYIGNLGHRLVANASDVKTPFNFFLIRNRDINAYAFFGGYVALHSGLFLHANSESELASVMAHEIAHVTQRHLARSMEEEARRSPATMAALAGALLLAIASPEAGIAAISATSAGSLQSSINYTRSNEKEADRFGLATLAKAGFDISAMPRFFTRLADEYRYASTPPAMLLTHPLPEDRITDSRIRIQKYPKKSVPFSLNYHLAKARIIARYSGIKPEAAHDWFDRRLKKGNKLLAPALNYGKALVDLDNKQLDQAEALLNKLVATDSSNEFYLDALSDLMIYKQQAAVVIEKLQVALESKPDNPVLMINYANALLESGDAKSAITQLQKYTHENQNDTNGWQLLAKANNSLGILDEELAARAEIFALKADWQQALQYYTQASQIAELGSLKQARYDARIDELLIQRDRFMALQ